MPHAFFIKRNLLILPLLLALAACSDGGGNAQSNQSGGRNLELPDSNKLQEPSAGETNTLILSFESPVTGSINYHSFNITAAEKSDYRSVSGLINVVQGETYFIEVDIYGDDEIEGNEQFGIRILDDEDQDILIIIGEISNDDLPAVYVNSPSISEGDTGTARLSFKLELNKPVVDPYTLHISSDACEGWDEINQQVVGDIRYANPCNDFENIDIDITFDQGVQSLSFDVLVIGDDILEKDEIVPISITSSGINVLPDSEFAIGIIRTDEEPNRNGFELTMAIDPQEVLIEDGLSDSSEKWHAIKYTVAVSNSNSFDDSDGIKQTQSIQYFLQGFSPELPNEGGLMEGELFYRAEFSPSALISDYCVNDPSGIFADDECEQAGTVELTPGTESFDFTFYVSADLISEPDENIEIILQNDQGVFFSRHFHQIQDDDDPELLIVLDDGEEVLLKDFIQGNSDGVYDALNVAEDGGSLQINLKLVNELLYPWSFSYAFNRPSNSGTVEEASSSDYARKSGEISFAVGSVVPENGMLSVDITNDEDYEGTELFGLNFVDINLNSLIINIIDDDFPALAMIMPNGEDIAEIPNTHFIDVPELVTGDLNSSSYFYKILLNASSSDNSAITARTDLNLFLSILPSIDGLDADNNALCGYLSEPTIKVNQSDYKLYINKAGVRNQLLDGESVEFLKGESQLNLELEIINDKLVECNEYLAIEFKLVDAGAGIDADRNDSLTKTFKIENKNKAVLSVNGWQTDEGSSLGAAVIQAQNFSMELDQAVITQIPYTIFGDNYGCNSDDVEGLTPAAFTEFSGSEIIKNVTVNINQDNVVEPQETCFLSVGDYNSELLLVQYCNVNEDCSENLAEVKGVINNDDLLNVTLSTPQENPKEPADTQQNLNPFYIKWDKDIAANVGAIDIDVQVAACLDSKACLSASEYEVNTLVIRTDDEVAQVAQLDAKATPYISVFSDEKVEVAEQLSVEFSVGQGSHYIASLKNPSLSVQVLNDDKLNLSFKQVTSTVPLGEESGYLEYSLGWGGVSVDATVGELSLDWLISGDAVRKTSAEQSTYDYSLFIDGKESLTDKLILKPQDAVLLANGSVNFQIVLNADELVEVDENIQVGLSLPKSSLYLANSWDTSGDNTLNGIAQHIIVNDDFLTVTITSTKQGAEGDTDEQGNPVPFDSFNPFTYAWDKTIAANVPSIEIAVTESCINLVSTVGASEQNCAELNDYVFSDNYSSNIISLHTQGENETPAAPNGKLLLTVVPDNRIEANEQLMLQISSISLRNISTNVAGQGYIESLLVVGSGTKSDDLLTVNSTIINDDTLLLEISESSATNCNGFENESGCQQFTLGWTKDIDSDVGAINFSIDRAGSTAKSASQSEIITGVETQVEPKDYKLTIDDVELSGNILAFKTQQEDLSGVKSKVIQLQILPDNFVEPAETVRIQLNPDSTFINIDALNDNDSGWFNNTPFEYTIPLDDQLALVFNKIADKDEPSVDIQPYSVSWINPVAKSTASIAIEIAAQGCVATNLVKCATPTNDFTVNALLPLHSINTFTPITSELDLGVRVKPDNIVEFNEEITLTVSAKIGSEIYLSSITQPPSYLIGNDDIAKVTLEAVAESATCSSENCTPVFDIKWDKGFAKELPRLSLDLSMLGTGIEASDYTFTLDTCEFLIDNPAACATSLTSFEIMPANRQDDTLAGDATRVAIHIKDDDLVEIDETLTLMLNKLGDNKAEYTVKGELLSVNHTIINDDFLTLSITSAVTGAEGDVNDQGDPLAASNFNPFSYAWDKSIDKNVPSIQFAVLQYCLNSENVNCAEHEDYTFSNNVTNHLITIHGEGSTTLAQPNGISLLTVEPDNRVENDEELHIKVSAVNLEAIETNVNGRVYIESLKLNEDNIAANGLISASSTIINDDKVQLSFSKASEDEDITNSGEGGFLSYKIDWQDVEVDSDVLLSLQLNIPNGAKAIRKPDTNTTNFDYTLKVGSDTGDVVTGNEWILKKKDTNWGASGNSTLYVQLNNDNIVELEEDISIELSILAGSHELAIEGASNNDTVLGTVSYTIPVADKVQLSLMPDANNLATASENSAKENIYTVQWYNEIADDVPELSFNLLVAANTNTEPEDFNETIPDGFFKGENTLSKAPGSFTFSTAVINDSIVELEESFTTALSIPNTNPSNAVYLTLLNTQETPNSFTHTITDADKVVLNLAVDSAASNEQEEAITYTVNWTGSAEANIAPLTFNLDITGDVTFNESNTENNDYSVTSEPFTQTNDGTYVLKAANSVLAADSSATLKLQVKQDSILEVAEALTVTLSSPLPSTLLEIGSTTATHTIINDDFLTLTINGAAQQGEPTGQDHINAYTLSWDKTIALPVNQIPSVSLLKNDCTGSSTLECLDTNDYTLSETSLALTTSSQTKIINLPLSLKPDDLVELQEKMALQLNVPSVLVEKIVFAESSETVTRAVNTVDALQMQWDLTVSSEDRLGLAMGTAIENITECNSATATCLPAQTINTLTITGEVAQNGPTITLQSANDCDDTGVNANFTCAQNSENENGGIDYTLQSDNAEFVLHTYNQLSNSDIKTKDIKISPAKDEWVEVEETIKLKVAPDNASAAYVTQNWVHNQIITLTSEDVVEVSLVRDATPATNENGLCVFEGGSSTNIEEATCTSQFDVTLNKFIASEVADISVTLTASDNSQLKIKAADGETPEQEKFDVLAQYGLDDIYPTLNSTPAIFSLPIHKTGSATKPADAKAFKLVYQDDARIELDESIQLVLSEGSGSQYTVPPLNNAQFTINETLKNDDFLILTISGGNTYDEPDAAFKPYVLSWNGEVDEVVTVSFNEAPICGETDIQKCLNKGNDYTLNLTTITIPLVDNTEGKHQQTLDLTLLKKDGLVEFQEIVNLQLVVDSPLVSSVVHDNGNASDTGNYLTSEQNGNKSTLEWALTVNSKDKLTLELIDTVHSITEACPSKDEEENCQEVATVGKIKVTGSIASNGPALKLSTTDDCDSANTSENSENCAILVGKRTGADNSEKDFTINQATADIALNGLESGAEIPIELTIANDAWVEVTESIQLAYITTSGADFISGLPTTQNIELTSEDTTTVTVARIAETGSNLDSTCVFETGTQTFYEGGSQELDDGCTSNYQFSISTSIAKEVGNIDAALQLTGTTTVTFTDDVIATISGVAVPLTEVAGNSQLSIPIHAKGLPTTTANFYNDTLLAFNHKEDPTAEGNELLAFNLIESTAATTGYYDVSGSAMSETVINDDSIIFTLTAPGTTDITEGETGDTTSLTYSLAWSGVAEIALTTLTLDFVIGGTATEGLEEDYSELSGIDYTTSLGGGDSSPISLANNQIVFTPTGANGSESITFNIKGDATVELPETISASLGISDAATTEVATLGSSDNVAINIVNDDFVTVALYSLGGGDENSGVQPFSYTLDKDIDANVPSILLSLDHSCNQLNFPDCASYSRQGYVDDFTIDGAKVVMGSFNIHTINTGTAQSEIQQDGSRLRSEFPIQYTVDNRLEDDETVSLKLDLENDIFNGYRYVANVNDGDAILAVQGELDAAIAEGNTPLVEMKEAELSILQENTSSVQLESVITNDDKFGLKIEKTSIAASTCTITSEESSNCYYKIKVLDAKIVDADVDEISLPIYHSGTAINQVTQLDSDNSVTTDPQDYILRLKFNDDGEYAEQSTNLILKSENDLSFSSAERKLKLSILEDGFVENTETIQFDLIQNHAHDSDHTHSISSEHISQIEYKHQSKTRFGVSQSMSNTDPLIVDVKVDSATIHSFDVNNEEILTDVAHVLAGSENAYKYINYTATLTNPVAPNYGAIVLSLADDDSGNVAVYNTDYTVGRIAAGATEFTQGKTVSIHEVGTSTPSNARIKTFRLEISADTTLELDEPVSQDLTLTVNNIVSDALTGLSNIAYTINNDDYLTVVLAGEAVNGVLSSDDLAEGTGDASTDITFNFTTDVVIPQEYPALNITLDYDGNSDADYENIDLSIDASWSNFTLHPEGATGNTAAITSANLKALTLSIVADAIVEPAETLMVTLGSNTGGIIFNDETGDLVTGLSQKILNDDYIQIEVKCTNDCVTLNEGEEVSVGIASDYQSEELTSAQRQIGFALRSGSSTTSFDYEIANTVTLPDERSEIDVYATLLTTVDDDVIENTETLNLTLTTSNYMEETGAPLVSDYVYKIADNDYLTFNRTQALIEGGTFDVQFCVPLDKTIQNDSGNLTFIAIASEKEGIDASSSFRKAACNSITLLNLESSHCDSSPWSYISNEYSLAVNNLDSGGCTTTSLLSSTSNTAVNQNVSLKLELNSLTDERLGPNTPSNIQDIVIINDDFVNMFDTGLIQCIDNGVWAKNVVECGDNNLQDAKTTDGIVNVNQYANLAYTYINESGEPVISKPVSGQVCIQDNNTGYIWTQTVVNPNLLNGFSRDDVNFPNSAAGYSCGFTDEDPDRAWSHPTVAELLTILDANKLKESREFGLLVSNNAGVPIAGDASITGNHFMRYWSQESCGVDQYFTVDFLTGLVACQAQTEINSVIGVYK